MFRYTLPAEAELTTPYGALQISFTGSGHCHVSTLSDNPVTYRGKQFHVSVHCYADHDWEPRPDSNNVPYVKRYRDYTANDDAPPTYARAIVAAVVESVRAMVASNPKILDIAEEYRLTMAYERAVAEQNRAFAALNTARNTANALSHDLKAARARLVDWDA